MQEKISVVSRRSFLAGAGAAVGGLAAGSMFGMNIKSAEAYVTTLPYPEWTTLDPATVKQNAAYTYFKQGGCMIGAAEGIIKALREAFPSSAWATFPVDVFKFGAGGAMSWGTVCGALNGAAAIIQLAVGPANSGKLIDNLFGWYQQQNFPSNDLDSWIQNHSDTAVKGKWADYSSVAGVKTVCNSPLCHASVSTWCDSANKGANSDAKKVRCAKLTADVAAYTVSLIETFKTSGAGAIANFTKTDEGSDCMDCHTGTGSATQRTAKLDSEQGKMSCEVCHEMPVGTTKNQAPICTDPKAGVGRGEL